MTGNTQILNAPVTTMTLNPAIDVTIGLDKLTVGEVNRAKTYRADMGGKGINVAATLAAGGVQTAVTGLLGKDNAEFFKKAFAAKNMENGFLYAAGSTRSNVKIVSQHETTDVNLPGLPVTEDILTGLRQILLHAKSQFLVLSGSVPPQCPDSVYADFLKFYAEQTGGKKAKCIVDCSGKPLKALLAGSVRPFCIKPNNDELAEWAGEQLNSQAEILAKARALHKTGIALVVVSMGGKGALFVAGDNAYFAGIKLSHVESTVGAGDAMVAGITAVLHRHNVRTDTISAEILEDIARNSTLWAAGKLQCHGPDLPSKDIMQKLAGQIRCEKLA